MKLSNIDYAYYTIYVQISHIFSFCLLKSIKNTGLRCCVIFFFFLVHLGIFQTYLVVDYIFIKPQPDHCLPLFFSVVILEEGSLDYSIAILLIL